MGPKEGGGGGGVARSAKVLSRVTVAGRGGGERGVVHATGAGVGAAGVEGV